MKKDFYNTLIISGSIILAFSQIPIYDSAKNLSGFDVPPGKFMTIIQNSNIILFIMLGLLFVLCGIIGNLKINGGNNDE